MDYTSLISNEEQLRVCDLMGGLWFKECFKYNSKIFNKIKPGFRVNKLTEASALATAKNNYKNDFIVNQINLWIGSELDQIQKSISEIENKGKTHDEAIALALFDSVFIDDLSIYLKLSCEDSSEERIKRIKSLIENEQSERDKSNDLQTKISDYEQEIETLKNKLSEVEKKYSDVCTERNQIVSNYTQQNNELVAKIESLNSEISNMKSRSILSAVETSDEQQRLSFEDKAPSELPLDDSEETVSLCEVYTDFTGSIWLNRYADIDNIGQIMAFHKNDFLPPYFSNRDKLYQKDGPNESGTYGVWNWSTVPNYNDPSKDYVITKFNPALIPIEIVMLPELSDINEVIGSLRSGYSIKLQTGRVMFSVANGENQYIGILCKSKDIMKNGSTISFSDSLIQVPVYEFSSTDIIKLENGKMFLNKIYAGIPSRIFRIKSLNAVVKDIVLNSISWTNYKLRGIVRSDYRDFKEFIASIPTETVIENICKTCQCNESVASELFEQFLCSITEHIDSQSVEDSVIVTALKLNDELMSRAKSLIKDEWESENADIISQNQTKLNDINIKINEASSELSKIQQTYSKLKSEKELLTNLIADKKQLAIDVEAAVSDKIKHAQDKVGEFIANMAFINNSRTSSQEISGLERNTAISARYYTIHDDMENTEAEAHSSWNDAIDTTVLELEEAGVSSKYSKGVATFLCAAYISKQPLLIVGPNAQDIIEAFSSALFAGKYGILQCEGDYASDLINTIGAENEHIVMINNLISSRWISKIPEITKVEDILFIGTHPFPEDIQVEPISIYNYVLPLFTEFFVDKNAAGNYCGGYFSDGVPVYKHSSNHSKEIKTASLIKCNMLVKNKISNILAIMHNLNKGMTDDEDFLFGILQYAYATMDMKTIGNMISEDNRHISNNLKNDLQYILGDNNE